MITQSAEAPQPVPGQSLDGQAGRWYPITLEYYELNNNAQIVLAWSSASTPKQVVPTDHLQPTGGPVDPVAPTVTATSPVSGATAVATFSEPMDQVRGRLVWTGKIKGNDGDRLVLLAYWSGQGKPAPR